jgi:uncharacterized protein (TIGR01777 family)
MRIVITGATGFIGTRLAAGLRQAGHDLVTLGRSASSDHRWDHIVDAPSIAFEGADAVIHLAGEPVAQKWTPEVKQRIRDSRVLGTERLVHGLSVTRKRPKALICASAVGYYGDRGDEILDEDSPGGHGFLAHVCREWESKADLAQALGMRVVKVRIGIVLGSGGGAIQEMLTPFKMGVGGRLGTGKQWMPWIHLDDIAGIFQHAVEGIVAGVLNGAAPGIVTNEQFTKSLGKAIHRPAVMPVPGFALKALYGEMAEALLGGARVIPKATEQSGYRFQYPDLDAALASFL